MKPLIFIVLLFIIAFLSNCKQGSEMVLKSEYVTLQDSIQTLNSKVDSISEEIVILNDSIEDLLIRPLMTSDQFIQLYKFGSLTKYYLLCKKNPVNWKYYRGWSSQVFEP